MTNVPAGLSEECQVNKYLLSCNINGSDVYICLVPNLIRSKTEEKCLAQKKMLLLKIDASLRVLVILIGIF